MINDIIVKNVATYDNSDHLIANLKKLNFFYGTNGSGKTTISRIINSPFNYKDSTIQWENNRPLNCMVYNKDFIRKNFQQSSNIPGVFTLGEDSIENQQRIKELQQSLTVQQKEKSEILNGIVEIELPQEQLKQKEDLKESFFDLFWKAKEDLDKTAIDIYLQGFKGSKQKFFEKVLEESHKSKSQLKGKSQLLSEQEEYDDAKKRELPIINLIHAETINAIEKAKILSEIIVGKDNTVISGLINKLNNSPWVNQGREYLSHSDGKCPFCQQELPEGFLQKIEDYFDFTYEEKIKELKRLLDDYQKQVVDIDEKLTGILDKYPDSILDKNQLQAKKSELDKILQHNTTFMKEKVAMPTIENKIQQSKGIIQGINTILTESNSTIIAQNERARNFNKEKIKSEVWRYVVDFLKSDIKRYVQQVSELEKTQKEQIRNLQKINKEITTTEQLLHQEEKKKTSVMRTINKINTVLKQFGFTNFKLDKTADGNNYKIVRMDGSDVGDTLSEGEVSFVTFLYFFFLLQGRNEKSDFNIEEEAVVVFDDPVSSLDNNILFIVATLIRSLFGKMISKDTDYYVKQLFVLTHNIYFFHELTNFQGIAALNKKNKKGKGNKNVAYYIIKKVNGQSTIVSYDDNPIKTIYQVLWEQVKNAEKNIQDGNIREIDLIGLPNVLRRIVEYYFKILGALSTEGVIKQLPEETRIYARSLLMYLNTSSHGFMDETIDIIPDIELIRQYLKIFKSIFYSTGNEAHYDMMMGYREDE